MFITKLFALIAFVTEGKAVGSPLDINPGVIFWTTITFLFLFFILKKFAWKPILNSLEIREKFIKNSLEAAEKAKEEAQKLILENKLNLSKAEQEAQKIINESRENAEKLRHQILEESKQQAKKLISDAQAEIERKNQEAFMKLKEQVAEIAVNAAEKIIRENLDKEKQSKIVQKYLKDLSKN